eukprot:765017-Hanusia_phi.AAC.2
MVGSIPAREQSPCNSKIRSQRSFGKLRDSMKSVLTLAQGFETGSRRFLRRDCIAARETETGYREGEIIRFAVGSTTLLVLSRDAFNRLCGSLFDILQRNIGEYKDVEFVEERPEESLDVVKAVEKLEFDDGQDIITQGDEGFGKS